jgi:hypothetical protein
METCGWVAVASRPCEFHLGFFGVALSAPACCDCPSAATGTSGLSLKNREGASEILFGARSLTGGCTGVGPGSGRVPSYATSGRLSGTVRVAVILNTSDTWMGTLSARVFSPCEVTR